MDLNKYSAADKVIAAIDWLIDVAKVPEADESPVVYLMNKHFPNGWDAFVDGFERHQGITV